VQLNECKIYIPLKYDLRMEGILNNQQISDNNMEKKETEEIEKKIKESPEKKEPELVDILKLLAPGTAIRVALDDILHANLGALIVLENAELYNIVEGGFRVNCKFSPQRLVELSKMDGAIIISKDLRKIIYANTLLIPSSEIPTKETGTRHKAAERTAKQINTLTIAVSERRNIITLYYGDIQYKLDKSSEILRKAAETLQVLEKQKEVLNELLANLNVLEINNLVTVSDICSVVQRMEMINRISTILKRYLVELGKEGVIVSMRLKELTKNLAKEETFLFRDYFGSKYLRAKTILKNMNFDFLIETQNLSRMLFNELHDRALSPHGLRILSKTNLQERDIRLIISSLKTLDKILSANEEELMKIFRKQEYVSFFNKEVESIREKIMIGRKI